MDQAQPQVFFCMGQVVGFILGPTHKIFDSLIGSSLSLPLHLIFFYLNCIQNLNLKRSKLRRQFKIKNISSKKKLFIEYSIDDYIWKCGKVYV